MSGWSTTQTQIRNPASLFPIPDIKTIDTNLVHLEIQYYAGGMRVRLFRVFLVIPDDMPIGIQRQYGITTYILSANRQRPLAGAGHNAIFNTARRVRDQFLYVAPPFVIAYLLLAWSDEKYVIKLLLDFQFSREKDLN